MPGYYPDYAKTTSFQILCSLLFTSHLPLVAILTEILTASWNEPQWINRIIQREGQRIGNNGAGLFVGKTNLIGTTFSDFTPSWATGLGVCSTRPYHLWVIVSMTHYTDIWQNLLSSIELALIHCFVILFCSIYSQPLVNEFGLGDTHCTARRLHSVTHRNWGVYAASWP
jgi:hypothetical protein